MDSYFKIFSSPNTKKNIIRSIYLAVNLTTFSHCFSEYGLQLVECVGPSMEPTILSSNVVICEHITPIFRRPTYGDIVIAKSVSDPLVNVCKRVTGIAGDIIWTGCKFTRVPQGHVWLQGDNSSESTDSRVYGPVPEALIRGRVSLRIWPLREMCVFW
ncbi:mitochondrial inner membrane protease subunit 1 isoform X1 [Cimex lectularius]|uniref:Peptidase S26 domain-containing protein n=1 Tax=Cimex lectularius TaxID=79782 RepID=A0A8I6RQB4_CIMLE|nr:mitochondrial inner membrane protease subunit 1 isoform X1 [Cimex lectularius]